MKIIIIKRKANEKKNQKFNCMRDDSRMNAENGKRFVTCECVPIIWYESSRTLIFEENSTKNNKKLMSLIEKID